MAGFGQAEVSIHVQDRHGNNVADGTPVSLNISEGGLIKYAQLSTVSGMATAVVVGGDNPALGATLTATALGADTPGTATIDILPLELSIAGLDGANFRGDQSEIVATVSAGGVPAPDVTVDMVATHGLVEDYTRQSDAQGQVRVPLLHLRPGEDAKLMVSVGVSVHQQIDYTVRYRAPQAGEQVIESVETMVLGDQTSGGVFTHERYDGASIPYDFATRSPFVVQGQPNEQLTVTLGDLSDPNLAPMAAWNMSDLEQQPAAIVTHEAALAPAEVEQIPVDAQQLAPVNGFALNLVLTAAEAPTDDTQETPTDDSPTLLLDMAGAYRLVREVDGSTSLEVNTSTGTYTLESAAVLTGSHRIDVNLIDGLLSFQIDDEREERELRDAVLVYQGTDTNADTNNEQGSEQTNYTLTAPNDQQLAISDLTFSTPALTPTPNGNAVDETTLHTATTTDVELTKDHPMGVGSSYRMNTGGAFSAPRTPSISSDNALGFRVDIKVPDALENTDTDTLMDLDGALQLGVTTEGKVQLSVTTTAGTQTLTSSRDAPDATDTADPASVGEGTLSSGRWHTVAARFFNDTLTLSVDGIIDQISVEGTLAYGDSGRYTLSAPTQTVHYNSFRLYDWNTENLLNLLDEASGLLPSADAGNTDTQQVQLDSTGRATLFIASRGQLNNQQAGSALSMLRVAVSSDNGRDTVSVISSEHYQSLVGFYVEHVAKDAPALLPSQQGALPGTLMIGALNYMVPPAEAFFGGLAWGALNFLIPIEDVGILIQQLYYLATNDPDFSMPELVGSALGTLTIIPLAKPLKPFIPGLKAFMRIGSRIEPRFFKNAAGPLGQAVKQAFRGRTDTLIQWLPMIYVMGEMAVDAESREALLFMINTIKSENDMLTWVEYLSMPTEGWEGEGGAVASVSDSSGDDQAFLDYFIGTASAVSKVRGVRVSAEKLNTVLQRVQQSGKFAGDDFSELISGISAVTRSLKTLNARSLRRVAHSAPLLSTSMALGGNGLRNLTNGLLRLRVSPLIVVSVISFLETRRTCIGSRTTPLFATCITPFPNDVSKRLNGKYSTLLKRLALSRSTRSGGTRGPETIQNEHGAMFHLAMLAYLRLQNELGSPFEVISQEQGIKFEVKNLISSRPIAIGRNVDIVLRDTRGSNLDNIWVETKSLTGSNLAATRWTIKTTTHRTSAHRQFSLDCIARDGRQKRALPTPSNIGFQWWIQDFNAPAGQLSGPSVAQARAYEKKLQTMPLSVDPSEFNKNTPREKICSDVDVTRFAVIQRFIAGGIARVIFADLDPAVVADLLKDGNWI